MDARGWSDVRFRGEYPVGTVDYGDPAAPLEVQLVAFSPFVPLDVEASSHPATVLRYTLKNGGGRPVSAALMAEFDNPVLLRSRSTLGDVAVLSEDRSAAGRSTIHCSAKAREVGDQTTRSDVLFEDFESGTYQGWQVEGTAFGTSPRRLDDIAAYQGDLNAEGDYLLRLLRTTNAATITKRHTAFSRKIRNLPVIGLNRIYRDINVQYD